MSFLSSLHLQYTAVSEWHRNLTLWIWQEVWTSTNLKKATWDETTMTWTLILNHNGADLSIVARHVIFATGAGGQKPVMPHWAGRVSFDIWLLSEVERPIGIYRMGSRAPFSTPKTTRVLRSGQERKAS